jgi:hypothetical protein
MQMLDFARELSKDFRFARVDFFEVNDALFFGEITLHPEGGLGPCNSYQADLRLGELISW